MASLGVAVVTLNEEKNIGRCLESVQFANEIVVVDSHSKDSTREIASQKGAKVIERDWPGYPQQKQFAVDQLGTEWVLVLDADEYLSVELQEELKKMEFNDGCNGYILSRQNLFMGKILKHGKGVDHVTRLFRKSHGKFDNREIHEEIIIEGQVGSLEYPAVHLSSEGVLDRIKKIVRDVQAEIPYMEVEERSLFTLFYTPMAFFFTYLVKKQAYKDGVAGIVWLLLFTIQLFIYDAVALEKSIPEKRRLKDEVSYYQPKIFSWKRWT